MEPTLNNKFAKTIVITGTNRGLGKDLVSLLIKDTSNNVVALSRKLTTEQTKYDPKRFTFIKIDLSNKNELNNSLALNEIIKTDEIVFINNASLINPISKVGTYSNEQISEIINVNIYSPMVIANYLLNMFIDKKITMINISSGAALKPIASWSLYCSTKATINMFFEVMKLEYTNHVFHNFDPGVMDTDMQEKIRDSKFDTVNDFIQFKKNDLLKSPYKVASNIISKYL